ncbi:MAG: MotA/TolQ/ExbB proton channel family protein [Pirellulaceae bacterium]
MNTIGETLMRQRAWLGCRTAAVAWLVWGVLGAGPLVCTSVGLPGAALAQEADDADLIDDVPAKNAVAEPAKNAAAEPAKNAAAEPDDGAAAPAEPARAEEPPPKKQRTLLQVALRALGWFYTVIFLLISFAFVALLVMNILSSRRESVCPTELVEGFEKHLDEKQYQEAYELAKGDDSFLGLVLSAGLAKLSAGYPEAVEAMQEVGQEENLKLDQRLSYIALIGTISPMVGLFGTVDGMVRSFSVIAESTGTPPPSQLADGVATALWTTLVGLAIAIPAIAVHHLIKNRIDRLVLEVGILSDGLMARFEHVGPRKK